MSLTDYLLKAEPSKKTLLLSNLLTIALALALQWNVLTILWGYWLQSVVIGLFTLPKILLARVTETKREKVPRAASALLKIFLAGFFCMHYGAFHAGYAVFLLFFSSFFQGFGPGLGFSAGPDTTAVFLMGAIFFLNHLFSFIFNYLITRKGIGARIDQVFTAPYLRVIPMHVTIIAAAFFVMLLPFAEQALLAFFLLIKTAFDLKGHESLHKMDFKVSLK